MPLIPMPLHLSRFCTHYGWGHCLGVIQCLHSDNYIPPSWYAPCSPTVIMHHCGLTESYRSDFIWRRMLVGWRHSLVSTLHHCRFSLWNLLVSRQCHSELSILWNPPLWHSIEKFPQLFSPWWCLLVIGALSYILGWINVWLCPMWACYIGGVRPVTPEGLGDGTCGVMSWHTYEWKSPWFCLDSPN